MSKGGKGHELYTWGVYNAQNCIFCIFEKT